MYSELSFGIQIYIRTCIVVLKSLLWPGAWINRLYMYQIAEMVAYILQQAKLEKYNTEDLIVKQGDVGET